MCCNKNEAFKDAIAEMMKDDSFKENMSRMMKDGKFHGMMDRMMKYGCSCHGKSDEQPKADTPREDGA
jgi:hypothetical protein